MTPTKTVRMHVRHGAPRSNPDANQLYATIHDATTNELLVSSTLDYAIDVVCARNWKVI